MMSDRVAFINAPMRIGELAKRAEVTPRTIRYYESLGLIPVGDREGSGQHYYPEETVARLRKIDQLKRLGLSLEEIGSVIGLYFSDPSGRRAKRSVLEILKKHLDSTDAQIAEKAPPFQSRIPEKDLGLFQSLASEAGLDDSLTQFLLKLVR